MSRAENIVAVMTDKILRSQQYQLDYIVCMVHGLSPQLRTSVETLIMASEVPKKKVTFFLTKNTT